MTGSTAVPVQVWSRSGCLWREPGSGGVRIDIAPPGPSLRGMTTSTSQAQGGLATALDHARRLLERDPALARQQAEAILEAVPRHADTTVVLAAAPRVMGAVVVMPVLFGLLALLLPMFVLGTAGTVLVATACLIWGMAAFVDKVGAWLFERYESWMDR